VQEREIRLERTLKHVRTLVSLEEVFGPGLLERMNNVSIACSWEPK
jgi:hypothetical protein